MIIQKINFTAQIATHRLLLFYVSPYIGWCLALPLRYPTGDFDDVSCFHWKLYLQNGASDDDKISRSIHLRDGSFAVLKNQKLTEIANEKCRLTNQGAAFSGAV